MKAGLASASSPTDDAKTTAVVAAVSLANGQAGRGSGGDTGGESGGVGGGGGANSGGDGGSESAGRASVQTANTAEAVPDNSGGTAVNASPAPEITADSVTLQQLASQITQLRVELESLRVTVQSLESVASRQLTAPRRLLRANSYQPGTQSLVTSTLSLEEGPNCALKDDEFYDALAVSLLHLEQESDKRNELRRKKNEELQEELGRKQEQEVVESGMKEEAEGSNPDEPKNREETEQSTTKEEMVDAGEKSQNVEKTDAPATPKDSQKADEHQGASTVKPPPPKPARSLSKAPSTEQDTTEPVATSASSVITLAASAPHPPLPPAAAPRGGCSGNCSQLGHALAPEIDRIITEQLAIVTADVSDGWSLFAQQGDMRMYKMEAPADNHSVDPLKAVSKAHGVTARELCRSYWDPNVRLEWETTVDRVTVIARPDPSTVVCHQVHRRIWPAQQRDTLFWSHICRRRVGDKEWSITVNHSIPSYPHEPPAPAGSVRAAMTATLAGRDEEEVSGDRRRLRCHVAYSSHVTPGGWVPTAGLKLVYKREYPRFLQTFTAYVTQKGRGTPVEV